MDSRGDMHIQDLLCHLELFHDIGRYHQGIVDDGYWVERITHCVLIRYHNHGFTSTLLIEKPIKSGSILISGHIRHVLYGHCHGCSIFRWCLSSWLAGRKGITLRRGRGSRTGGEISIGCRIELSAVVWEFGCICGIVAQCLHIGMFVEYGIHGTL